MSHGIEVEVRQCCDPAESFAVPELPVDTVQVWIRPLNMPPPLVQACYRLLSQEERERATRYRVERPRSDFIVTRGTLRSLLAGYLATTPESLPFQYSGYGKPLLDRPSDRRCGLRFNVSHTDGLALLAFVRGREIGVDVEKIKAAPDARKLAERFFSIRERTVLERLSGEELDAAFFRCWTRKEAYIKARGEGLSLPLHQFDVSVANSESPALLATRPDPSEAGRWILRDVPTSPGYAAALAVQTSVD
jgi:4'-phosphopantetheinyl transferase